MEFIEPDQLPEWLGGSKNHKPLKAVSKDSPLFSRKKTRRSTLRRSLSFLAFSSIGSEVEGRLGSEVEGSPSLPCCRLGT